MSAEQPNPEPGGPCPKCDGSGGAGADAVPQWMGEWVNCKACDGTGEYWPEEDEMEGGLLGDWDFEVTHEGAVYKCSVRDERITITAPSGVTVDAKWNGTALADWCGWDGGTGSEDMIPDAVCDEAEDQMRAMAESVSS